ncbi:MAG: hypothetical protein CM15mV13_1870 [uncultured marine virus]|nr:MAG: hypothetical protein CM15mV13_1870 [uncultured marine virus]
MFALISTEDMEAVGQLMVKQLKNRYNDPTSNKRFVVGLDRNKMRLYDADEQGTISDSGQQILDKLDATEVVSKNSLILKYDYPRNPMVAGVDGTIPESELPLEDTADTGLPDGKKVEKQFLKDLTHLNLL